jgi:hypothetical protein
VVPANGSGLFIAVVQEDPSSSTVVPAPKPLAGNMKNLGGSTLAGLGWPPAGGGEIAPAEPMMIEPSLRSAKILNPSAEL